MNNNSFNKERQFGLDILRIIAMFMIVCLHVSGHGGIPGRLRCDFPFSINYFLSTCLHYSANVGVDLFIVLSGYLYSFSKWKISNLLKIIVSVIFYSVLSYLVARHFYDWKINGAYIRENCGTYWFINLYIGLFCFVPFLNKLLDDIKTSIAVIITGFLLFSFIPSFFRIDLLQISGGHNLLWFLLLYLCGGICGKYKIEHYISYRWLLFIYVSALGISMGSKLLLEFLRYWKNGCYVCTVGFFPHNSPFSATMALSLLLIFAKIKKVPKPLAAVLLRLSPLMLGIYLCHASNFFYEQFLLKKLVHYPEYPPFIFAVKTLAAIAMVFVCCLCVEFIRSIVFSFCCEKKIAKAIDEKCTLIHDTLWKPMLNIIHDKLQKIK